MNARCVCTSSTEGSMPACFRRSARFFAFGILLIRSYTDSGRSEADPGSKGTSGSCSSLAIFCNALIASTSTSSEFASPLPNPESAFAAAISFATSRNAATSSPPDLSSFLAACKSLENDLSAFVATTTREVGVAPRTMASLTTSIRDSSIMDGLSFDWFSVRCGQIAAA